jgi:hypothetical protein
MTRLVLLGLFLCSAPSWAQNSLRGTVTDPSGAVVPGALVRLRGPGGERRMKTGETGQYASSPLEPGKYQVRITAKGFAAARKDDLVVDRDLVIDASLSIAAESQVVVVEGELSRVSAEPDANAGAFNTGYPAERPALLAAGCVGPGLRFAPGYGCFDLNPSSAARAIPRNYGRGPAAVNLALRVSRTWAFGGEGRSGPSETGSSHGNGAIGGGPPAGMFAANTGRRYNLTLRASSLNALNRANFAPPGGDLSSPYFGQYRALGGLIVMAHGGGAGSYNRKIDLQLRFTF